MMHMTTFDQLTTTIRKHRIASDRAAFVLGAEWAANHFIAAASLVEPNDPIFASRLRDIAGELIGHASTQAIETYPDWKD